MANAFAERGRRAATVLVLLLCLLAAAGTAVYAIADPCGTGDDSLDRDLACAGPRDARWAALPTLNRTHALAPSCGPSRPVSPPASPRTLRAPPGL